METGYDSGFKNFVLPFPINMALTQWVQYEQMLYMQHNGLCVFSLIDCVFSA